MQHPAGIGLAGRLTLAGKLCYALAVGGTRQADSPAEQNRRGGVERSMKMPNAGEIIERLARESERQKIEIEALKRQGAELENQLAQKG